MVKIEADPDEEEKYIVTTETNLADHVLVVGERYQMEDIKAMPASHLGTFTSGVSSDCTSIQ